MCFCCSGFFKGISLLYTFFTDSFEHTLQRLTVSKIASVNVYILDVTNTQAYSKSTQVYSTPTIQTLNNKQLQWFHSVPFEWMLFTPVCAFSFWCWRVFYYFFLNWCRFSVTYTTNAIAQVRYYKMDQSAWMCRTLE